VTKKLTGRARARFGAGRDIWQEVLDACVNQGWPRQTEFGRASFAHRARALEIRPDQAQFAALLGVSKRTWSNGSKEGAHRAQRQRR